MKIWEPKPPGTLWATPGMLRDCFTFTFSSRQRVIFLSDVQKLLELPGFELLRQNQVRCYNHTVRNAFDRQYNHSEA